MGVWSSIILILAMSGVFGFHLMTKLDKCEPKGNRERK